MIASHVIGSNRNFDKWSIPTVHAQEGYESLLLKRVKLGVHSDFGLILNLVILFINQYHLLQRNQRWLLDEFFGIPNPEGQISKNSKSRH